MVQLRSELESLQQCRIDPTVSLPAWQLDDDLRKRLDGQSYEQVLEWMGGTGQKVLIVGGACPEFAAQLSSRNMFVTVIDDNVDRIRHVQSLANEQGGLGTVTCHVDDYSQRQFERAAFNRIIAWDVLNRFPSVDPIIRKMTRELKTGGMLCVRSWVTPDVAEPGFMAKMGALWKGLSERMGESLENKCKQLIREHGPIPSHATAIPVADLMASLTSHLVIQEHHAQHTLSADIAELLASGHGDLAPLLEQTLEHEKEQDENASALARYTMVLAANEKQLGKVFSLNDGS